MSESAYSFQYVAKKNSVMFCHINSEDLKNMKELDKSINFSVLQNNLPPKVTRKGKSPTPLQVNRVIDPLQERQKQFSKSTIEKDNGFKVGSMHKRMSAKLPMGVIIESPLLEQRLESSQNLLESTFLKVQKIDEEEVNSGRKSPCFGGVEQNFKDDFQKKAKVRKV